MSIRKTIELNIVHPVDPADGRGFQIELLDITLASKPAAVFSHGGNAVLPSPFTYDFALNEGHMKFGNQYRITVRITDGQGEVYGDAREFSVGPDAETEVIGLKLARS
ncbi:hypothetical protein PS910_01412 [Pseudomonas fluorescens]|nr:hypothetical protein PS910_01412 [Pseudomonas fluorescens]